MMRWILVLVFSATAFAQINPPKYAAYVNPGTGWAPWSVAAAGGAISQPPSIALYCKATASAPWTPCTGSGGSATPIGPAGGDLSGTYPNPTVTTSHITSGTAAFTGTVSTTGNVNVQGNVSSSSNTSPANPTNSGVLLNATPNIADVMMFDSTRAVNDRTAEWIFWSGAASLRFANDIHSAVAVPLSVTGGQASGITGITSDSGSGAWAHTGKFSATSTAATASTSTFTVSDTEAAAASMTAVKVLVPNMANGNIAYSLLGNAESTNNSFFLSYARIGAGSTSNRFSIQPYGVPIAFSIFASQNVAIGPSTTDSGFKLDVAGTLRGQTSVTSPTYLTPNSFVGRSQTGALNQTIIASANTAMYRISLASNCRTAGAAVAYTATVSYTDTSNTVQTVSSGAIPCDTLGLASKFNSISVANVLTGTGISLTTSTTGAVSYDVAVTAEQVTGN